MKKIIYSAVFVFLVYGAVSAAEEVLYPKQKMQASPVPAEEAAAENTPAETADETKDAETGEEAELPPEKDSADETEEALNKKEIEEKKTNVPGSISFDNSEPDVVVLKWTDTGTEEVYYNVFRKKSEDENFSLLNKEPFPETEYRDEEIEFETEYVYYLEAVNEEGERESSKEFSFITKKLNLPAVPGGFKTYQDVEKVILRWSGSSPGTFPLSGYNIYRGRTPENQEFLKFVEKTETAYTDEDVEPAIKYYYAMSALDSRGNETPKTEVSEVVPFPKPRTGLILMPTAYRNNIKDNFGFNADVYFNYYIGSIFGEYDSMVFGKGTDTFGKIGLWLLTADM
ncbi:MAG: fibronectin type III domain-containing protein, partial [bacterium]